MSETDQCLNCGQRLVRVDGRWFHETIGGERYRLCQPLRVATPQQDSRYG